jgi:hypothetical protein
MQETTRTLFAIAAAAISAAALAQDWNLPADGGTLKREALAAIVARDDYPATSGFTQRVDYIDFSSFGQDFTQVVVTLTPDKPRLHRGRKIVVVGGEPGSEYAGDFLETPEGGEGPGVWLAKRGVKFVALTRVGRWNFLAPGDTGSWEGVPLEARMPIFNRRQKAHWTAADFEVKSSGLQGATSGDSAVYRLPKPNTALYRQMLAATPATYLTGYRLAIERAIPPASAATTTSSTGECRPAARSSIRSQAAAARRLSRMGHEQHRARVPLSARERRRLPAALRAVGAAAARARARRLHVLHEGPGRGDAPRLVEERAEGAALQERRGSDDAVRRGRARRRRDAPLAVGLPARVVP